MLYGISESDIIFYNKKLEQQRSFLNNKHIVNSNGEVKTFLDISMSANLSERYYNTLINKINTFKLISSNFRLVPIFLTVTLDGFFRDFLCSNFKRYNNLKNRNFYDRYIPNNERFGFLRDKINNNEVFTIKDLYNILNFQLWRFIYTNVFRKMRKLGYKRAYIRATEPHRSDGVPHIHMLLWIHNDFVDEVKNKFYEYFPAKQKKFEVALKNPVGYILKYTTKSFLNIKKNQKLDALQVWYLKYKIRRFTTSFSVLPFWIYKKIFFLNSDWFDYTVFYDVKEKNFKKGEFVLYNSDLNHTIVFKNNVLKIYHNNKLFFSKDFNNYYIV